MVERPARDGGRAAAAVGPHGEEVTRAITRPAGAVVAVGQPVDAAGRKVPVVPVLRLPFIGVAARFRATAVVVALTGGEREAPAVGRPGQLLDLLGPRRRSAQLASTGDGQDVELAPLPFPMGDEGQLPSVG